MKYYIISRERVGKEKEQEICPDARYWDCPAYHEYIAIHGKHFSKKLAVWATKQLENEDGTFGEHWTCEQVRNALVKFGYSVGEHQIHDIHYAVNHEWSDHFGETKSLKSDRDVFMYVMETVNDKDGYESAIFSMFLIKCMEKCVKINWEEMK